MEVFKNILIISYQFPPENSGGSLRPYRFAQNLYKYGLKPIVVARSIGNEKFERIDNDNFIEYRIPTKKKNYLYKLRTSYYFNIYDPDFYIWKTNLYTYLDRIIIENQIDIVLITMPPFSMSRIGYRLKNKYKMKLIFDWRDHWSQWNTTPYATYFHYIANLWLERKCLKIADVNIVVTPQMRKDLLNLHKKISNKKIKVITNSFEGGIDSYKLKPKNSTIKIGYVGSFYFNPKSEFLMKAKWYSKKPYQWFQYIPFEEDWKYRSPYYFLKIIKYLKDQNQIKPDDFKLIFAGKKEDWLEKMILSMELTEFVEFKGFLTYKESMDFQSDCDYLLITSSKVIGGRAYTIAGKTFEYFQKSKPIIAVVPEGDQKEIILHTKTGFILDPDEVEKSSDYLLQIVSGAASVVPDTESILQYSAENTTKKIANIINKFN
ncbi:glycosyltransferase [Marivirga arenosa]|uniref:Glycosyltransferase n=1 Tax=Marivirga arenosa TaxID=3059076 RepID=A0AA51ZWK7_9BACT|nr:glycosyltransferase [Marivirga sp. BKB1-2]WNB18074.1 glycosyltransferase [Marivirga sp. BKB1-2]